jgi:hypothetical protein
MNPAVTVNAAYAAQQVQAKQKAEATRKKLFESASRIAGETEGYIVTISERQGDNGQQKKNSRQDTKQERTEADVEVQQVSDWV